MWVRQPITLVRLHGGAGITTLVRLLDPKGTGQVTEGAPGAPLPHGSMPMLVARSTPLGLRAAAVMLTAWPTALPRPGLIVVADTPLRASQLVRYRMRGLSGQVRGLVQVPYLLALREVDDPTEALDNRRAAAAVARVRSDLLALMSTEVPL